jgi:hypothetical protein
MEGIVWIFLADDRPRGCRSSAAPSLNRAEFHSLYELRDADVAAAGFTLSIADLSKYLSALWGENSRSSAKACGDGDVMRRLILRDVGDPLRRDYSPARKEKDFHLPNDLKGLDAGG